MQQIIPGPGQMLHSVATTRHIEETTQSHLPPNTLMQRAGLAVAQLVLALAPHARRIWLACGPGNNGGDGLEAAVQLLRLGKTPIVTWLGNPGQMPVDTAAAHARATAAGVEFATEPCADFDLGVDALLGIGGQPRPPEGRMAHWINRLNDGSRPVLSIDIPSGLNADTGAATALHVKASHTVSLLTLKPGLFTAQGRDAAGSVWFDSLGIAPDVLHRQTGSARLLACAAPALRLHHSHKGSYGDVVVIGGASGMTGAALLAATAALHFGAGRVLVGLLDAQTPGVDMYQPELMFRAVDTLDCTQAVVVCGCGGGTAVHARLAGLLALSSPLVLDADALNAIACDRDLQSALATRASRAADTVLTPHPLEAARLSGCSAHEVQHDRLAAAQTLSQRFGCTVVLKGSGTVIAAPRQIPMINPTGSARLATAGTGDVLAGMTGAALAGGRSGFEAACHAVYQQGRLADEWPASQPLTAGQLASRLCAC